MTAQEPDGPDGLDDDELDVFQPRRAAPAARHPFPGFDDDAWTRSASRAPLRVALTAPGRAEPAPRRQTRALRLVVGTAVVAVCALLAPVVFHDTAPAPGEAAAEQAALAQPPDGPAAAPGTPTTGAVRASSSPLPSAPRIQPASTRIPAVTTSPANSPSGPSHRTPAAPRSGGDGPHAPRGHRLSLRSVNFPERFWSAAGDTGRLDAVGASSTRAARRAATFVLVTGLADARCASFATTDGRYLRHEGFRIRLDRPDGSALFREDATFCARPGIGRGTVSFASYDHPERLLRHRDFRLRLDPYRHDSSYRADSSFRIAPPWAG
ncbi:AbfB domain-containing protein [Streptomyces sp. NPDC088354]|uniref:AbfB domain-containing protein n=1 Tax=Streptomyces sp. NPDC088354 TaxID=3365856 RepID=UPI00382BF93D